MKSSQVITARIPMQLYEALVRASIGRNMTITDIVKNSLDRELISEQSAIRTLARQSEAAA